MTRRRRDLRKAGIENANDNFYGVDSDGPDDVSVSGGGSVYRYDGDEWVQEATPVGANHKGVLRGRDAGSGRDVAVGASGTVFETEAER